MLTVTLTPFFPLADGEEWNKEEEVLIKGVRGFSLAYFGPEEGQTDSRWQDEWLQRDESAEAHQDQYRSGKWYFLAGNGFRIEIGEGTERFRSGRESS